MKIIAQAVSLLTAAHLNQTVEVKVITVGAFAQLVTFAAANAQPAQKN